MAREAVQVVTDDAVSSSALALIREANEYVVLVSPYNALWTHLKNEITLAIRRGARVTAVYNPGGHARGDGVEWLLDAGAAVYKLPNLHAKLCLNESSALLSTMNLVGPSSRNSMDVGMLVRGGDAYTSLQKYAARLVNLGERVEQASESDAPADAGQRDPSPVRSDGSIRGALDRIRAKFPREAWKVGKTLLRRGHCVRCQKIVGYAPSAPLCDRCYAEWNRYKNPHYGERFCHKCGEPSQTSYARPLCSACYSKP